MARARVPRPCVRLRTTLDRRMVSEASWTRTSQCGEFEYKLGGRTPTIDHPEGGTATT